MDILRKTRGRGRRPHNGNQSQIPGLYGQCRQVVGGFHKHQEDTSRETALE